MSCLQHICASKNYNCKKLKLILCHQKFDKVPQKWAFEININRTLCHLSDMVIVVAFCFNLYLRYYCTLFLHTFIGHNGLSTYQSEIADICNHFCHPNSHIPTIPHRAFCFNLYLKYYSTTIFSCIIRSAMACLVSLTAGSTMFAHLLRA